MNIFLPIATVWKRERAVLVLFCFANLIFGQLGIIGAFLIATLEDTTIGKILDQNLKSGNLYVFAVTLLVTTCTILVAEYLDAEKENQRIELKSHKVIWALMALLLVLLQSMLTGTLIARTLRVDSGLASPPLEAFFDAITAAGSMQQLLLWMLSMVIAVQVFCLSRMHKHPTELDQMRKKDIEEVTEAAEKLETTSDGEKV